ncbi:hypothetical protein JXM67_15370 [candidate division WOR-3 bacterium]|nr:hypothetical protein [candidate division WOR-3 bacterium]
MTDEASLTIDEIWARIDHYNSQFQGTLELYGLPKEFMKGDAAWQEIKKHFNSVWGEIRKHFGENNIPEDYTMLHNLIKEAKDPLGFFTEIGKIKDPSSSLKKFFEKFGLDELTSQPLYYYHLLMQETAKILNITPSSGATSAPGSSSSEGASMQMMGNTGYSSGDSYVTASHPATLLSLTGKRGSETLNLFNNLAGGGPFASMGGATVAGRGRKGFASGTAKGMFPMTDSTPLGAGGGSASLSQIGRKTIPAGWSASKVSPYVSALRQSIQSIGRPFSGTTSGSSYLAMLPENIREAISPYLTAIVQTLKAEGPQAVYEWVESLFAEGSIDKPLFDQIMQAVDILAPSVGAAVTGLAGHMDTLQGAYTPAMPPSGGISNPEYFPAGIASSISQPGVGADDATRFISASGLPQMTKAAPGIVSPPDTLKVPDKEGRTMGSMPLPQTALPSFKEKASTGNFQFPGPLESGAVPTNFAMPVTSDTAKGKRATLLAASQQPVQKVVRAVIHRHETISEEKMREYLAKILAKNSNVRVV